MMFQQLIFDVLAFQIFVFYFQHLHGSLEKVVEFEARAAHLFPSKDGMLVYLVGGGGASVGHYVACQYLHVEQPAGDEFLVEEGGNHLGAVQLGAALGVVHRQSEHDGGGGGETAAEVVAQFLASHSRAETQQSQACNTLVVVVGCDVDETRYFRQRSGEVGIPETDEIGLQLSGGVDHTAAHGLGFASVLLEIEHKQIRMSLCKGVEHLEGVVAAAVVDKKERNVLVFFGKSNKSIAVETLRLVVAGHYYYGVTVVHSCWFLLYLCEIQ